MAASTSMKGTLIANNGAISMGAGGILEGRMFSTTGAASIYSVDVTVPPCTFVPVELLYFKGICHRENVLLKWSTATEINNDHFSIERSVEGLTWNLTGKISGKGNSSNQHTYTFTDRLFGPMHGFYRLKQTDLDGNYKYWNIVSIKKCGKETVDDFLIHPNASSGKFELKYTGNTDEVNLIELFTPGGQRSYVTNHFQSEFDLSNKAPGVYLMRIHCNGKKTNLRIVIIR